MKKRMFCLLLALFILVSCSSSTELPDRSQGLTTEKETVFEPQHMISLIQNGKTDFVILVDNSDVCAKNFANYLQSTVSAKTGILIPIKSSLYADSYEHKILIGCSGVSASEALEAQTPQNAFSVSVNEKDLVMFADGILGYSLLEQYLSGTMLASAQKDEWSFALNNSNIYIGSTSVEKEIFMKNSSTVYHLVYDSTDSDARVLANGLAVYIMEHCGIKIKPVSDASEYENEILFGSVNRAAVQSVEKYLSNEDTYVSGVLNGSYVILSKNRIGMLVGGIRLVEKLNGTSDNSVKLGFADTVCETISKDQAYAEAVTLANSIFGTYNSYVSEMTQKSNTLSADQRMIEAMIDRMGNSVAVSVGSSSALYHGNIVKLDKTDYGMVTKVTDAGHILMAAEFAKVYFGSDLNVDTDGYVNISAYCQTTTAYSLYCNLSLGLAIVTPSDVVSFERSATEVNGYTNGEYITRMAAFFNNDKMPEPSTNVEQSRIVIDSLSYDTQYIFDYTQYAYDTFYSPAICNVTEDNGATTLYVAYEKALYDGGEAATETYLKRSQDGGLTWEMLGSVDEMRWASLFAYDGKLYLLGNHREEGSAYLAIFDMNDNSIQTVNLGIQVGGGAPNTVKIANGRIYKAYNNAVISASVSGDLTVSASWSRSNDPQELITRDLYVQVTGKTSNPNYIFRLEEGNVIAAPNGSLYVMYRIDAAPSVGTVALFALSADGATLSVIESCSSLVEFPYAQSKFSIRYDEVTGLYISLTSLSTQNYVLQRNVLGLAVSRDLIHWEVVDILLVDREMMNSTVSMYAHGFQYVDFVICDGDIYFIVREAVGDTIRFHDANYVTLYTISDYADFINSRVSLDA